MNKKTQINEDEINIEDNIGNDSTFKMDDSMPLAYIMKEDRLNELKHSAITFIVFAIILTFITFIISIGLFGDYNLVFKTSLSIITFGLYYLAISSFIESKKLKPQAIEENYNKFF